MTRLNLPLSSTPATAPRAPWSRAIAPLALLASVGSLALLFPSTAAAQSPAPVTACDLRCDKGFSCQIMPPACPAIYCTDADQDCPSCDGPGTPYCAPVNCESDADCGEGMLCPEPATLDCAAPPTPDVAPASASDSAEPISAPLPPECAATITRTCTPRWQLPCEADSDCGPGFFCEVGDWCTVPADPGDPDAAERAAAYPSDIVTCAPRATFSCVVIETPCEADADCAPGLACMDNSSGSCSSSSNGETRCDPVEPAKLCAVTYALNVGSADGVGTVGATEERPRTAEGPAIEDTALNSAAGCSVTSERAPRSALALLGTLGLALAMAARRSSPTSRRAGHQPR